MILNSGNVEEKMPKLKMLWCDLCKKGHELSDNKICPDCKGEMSVKRAIRLFVCPVYIQAGREGFHEKNGTCPFCQRKLAETLYPVID